LNLIGSQFGQAVDIALRETANMRTFETTGCGAFLLTENFDNLDQYFETGKEIETYHDERELIDKIDYYLAHHKERQEIARRGQQRCLSDYSMEKRAAHFDKIVRTHLSRKANYRQLCKTSSHGDYREHDFLSSVIT
jgi:spore maturation protein CgeB